MGSIFIIFNSVVIGSVVSIFNSVVSGIGKIVVDIVEGSIFN